MRGSGSPACNLLATCTRRPSHAYKNVVSTGSAGAAVILGSYNEGLNEAKIEEANVNGVFVARAMRTMNGDDDDFGKAIGLVDTMTCMPCGTLDLSAHVDNLVMASGHFRSGLHLSTGTAVLMADLLEHKTSEFDWEHFSLIR